MRLTAAANNDRSIGKATPQKIVSQPGQETNPGLGCVTEVDDCLFEGRYSPKWPDGKKYARNVYAHTREECEAKLKVLIVEMKAEIAEAKRLKAEGTLPWSALVKGKKKGGKKPKKGK